MVSSHDKSEEYKTFFDEFGFVIIDRVLDDDEIEATRSEIWENVENFDWSMFDFQPNEKV